LDTGNGVTVCSIQESEKLENGFEIELQLLIRTQSEDPELKAIVKMRLKGSSRPSAKNYRPNLN